MGKISLTIDNGPDPQVTPAVLDVLAAKTVTASFFLIGERAAAPGGQEPAIINQARDDIEFFLKEVTEHKKNLNMDPKNL